MKVSISWLKELVDLKVSLEELVRLLPLRTIGIKEITEDSIELDMKGYNRADLLSMRGVAYEVTTITDSVVTFKEEDATYESIIEQFKDIPQINAIIENTEICPVYCVAKIERLKVEESDEPWKKKLLGCGMRPINNIADITNLMMLEYGQPLHAFDAQAVQDQQITVRNAKQGEKLITLDGKERKLSSEDLLITDTEKILGLAGIMGGKDSEVTNTTSSILLEAAIFDPKINRKTATRLFLQSEASKRFQHGLTKKRLFQAFLAAINAYQSIGGKVTELTIIDNSKLLTSKIVELNHNKVNALIGVEIPKDEVEKYLNRLNFKISSFLQSGSNNSIIWSVSPPFWRLDVNIEEDLIEEVARMYGYEKILPKPLTSNIPNPINQELQELIYNLKTRLIDLGLTEVQTYSYYSSLVLNNLKVDKNNLVKISNPISAETEYLREDLWPNLIEIVSNNLKTKDLAIFEIGKTYHPEQQGLPLETYRFSAVLINNTDNPTQELYQIFKIVFENLKIPVSLSNEGRGGYEDKYFHPTRFSFFKCRGKKVGGIGEVHPRITHMFEIEQRVAILEVEVKDLLESI